MLRKRNLTGHKGTEIVMITGLEFYRCRTIKIRNSKKKIKSTKLAETEQSHPSSEGSVAHYQTPQVRNSLPQTKDLLDRLVSKIP